MSLFAWHLTVPDRIFAPTCSYWLSRIPITAEASGWKIGLGGRNHSFTSSVWPDCFVESLRCRATCMQQPQWPPLTTVGSTVCFCFSCPSFPTSPPPSTSNTRVQEVSWLTLHRKFYTDVWPKNIKPSLHCVRGCKNWPFFYSELSH